MSDKEEGSLPDSDASPVRGSPKSRSRSPSPVTRSRSRSLSASRSRSRSPRRRHKRSRSRSRGHRYSRSRSRSPYQRRRHRDSHGGERSSGRRRHRSHSRSPMSSRRRHQGNRDDPEPTRCLGVFGLSLHTQERDLREVFDRYGSVEEVQVVYDRQSGRSRGFSFVYFKSVNDAIEANPQPEGRERGNEVVVVVVEEEGEEEETGTREVNAVKEAIAVTDMTEMDRTVMEAVLMDTASTTLMTDTIAIDHLLHIGEDRLPLTTVADDHDPGPDLGPTPLHVAIKES